MRNLPIHRSASASGIVNHRDRWFAWANANSIFNTLLYQKYFMPFTSYDPTSAAYITPTNWTVATLSANGAVPAMEGPLNFGVPSAVAGSYFYVTGMDAYLDCEYPVVALWVRNRPIAPAAVHWWFDRLSAGANMSWGIGLNAANQVMIRLSWNGVVATDLTPTNPADISKWNFYAFQHKSATETNVLINDQLTVYNTGLTIFTGGVCDLRIGWKSSADIALVALANDNSANCVQKLLGLYYHSRYAFRDDWT